MWFLPCFIFLLRTLERLLFYYLCICVPSHWEQYLGEQGLPMQNTFVHPAPMAEHSTALLVIWTHSHMPQTGTCMCMCADAHTHSTAGTNVCTHTHTLHSGYQCAHTHTPQQAPMCMDTHIHTCTHILLNRHPCAHTHTTNRHYMHAHT